MNGSIQLESQLGKGSAFTVCLPVAVMNTAHSAQLGVSCRPEAIRALLVDDEIVNRQVISALLTSLHVAHETASSPEEALFKLRHPDSQFTHLISDAGMPGMDGYELIQRVITEQLIVPSNIRILSSSPISGDAGKCKRLGIPVYLTKPVTQTDLKETLQLHTTPIETQHELILGSDRDDPLKVLLAKDHQVNQLLITKILERHSVSLEIAENGEEALKKFTTERFDVILMDIMMPKLDGLAATLKIRELESELPTLDELLSGRFGEPKSEPTTFQPVKADVVEALAMMDNDAELFQEAFELFKKSLPKHLRALRGDQEQALIAAHTLKSSFASFGLSDARSAAATLEKKLRNEHATDFAADIEAVIASVDNIPVDFPMAILERIYVD